MYSTLETATLSNALEPVFNQLNDGEEVARKDIDGAVEFIRKTGVDQNGALDMNGSMGP